MVKTKETTARLATVGALRALAHLTLSVQPALLIRTPTMPLHATTTPQPLTTPTTCATPALMAPTAYKKPGYVSRAPLAVRPVAFTWAGKCLAAIL